MAIPTLNIYAVIGAPTEANNYTGVGTTEFGYMLQGAVNSGESRAQVRINSGGGSWEAAQGIYGMIKASALKIDTYCDGLAASSASLIFMAGAKRYISAHARLMIHNCSCPSNGTVEDHERTIEMQRAINESMASVYANATGLPLERITTMMSETTWLTAEQAFELGFATAIINQEKKALAPAADVPTASLQAYYAALLPQHSTMKNLLLPILTASAAAGLTATAGITASATDEQVTAAVQATIDELTALRETSATQATALATATTALTELQAKKEETDKKLADLEKKEVETAAAAKDAEAVALVSAAVKDGRILAAQEAGFVALAKTDATAVSAVLASLTPRQSLTQQVSQVAASGGVVLPLSAAGAMAEIMAKQA